MTLKTSLYQYFQRLVLMLSIVSMGLIVYELGFRPGPLFLEWFGYEYLATIAGFVLLTIFRYIFFFPRQRGKEVLLFDTLLAIFLLIMLSEIILFPHWMARHTPVFSFLDHREWLYAALFLVFVREISVTGLALTKYFNPALLFVVSFMSMIGLGTAFLMLPAATHADITFLDALFTSTSAVCVTGLIVVDTGTFFTGFGQTVILVLIQLGGLGIMTFTSYFTYFFKGAVSYEDQLMLQDMTNSERIADVFTTLKRIFLLTFGVEIVGALVIFLSIDNSIIDGFGDQAFFAIFHSISAFCNAGFSTLGNSLFEAEFRFNWGLHLIIAFLFIIGGIGFPIVFNFFRYMRHLIFKRWLPFSRDERAVYVPWIITMTSKIVLVTTAALLVGGMVLFFILEYDNTLEGYSLWGKIVTSFFEGAVPRTAGFNSVDMAALEFSTIMVFFLLMWIGASPASTGGGIKTTTFAVGILNFMSLAKGKDRVEAFRREISDLSIRRAFAVISLSLIVIGMAVFLLAVTDPDKHLLELGFEAFSAYSTVGLSLGITGDLSPAGKIIIIITMFIGRVSMLTILAAILRKVSFLRYRYPKEEIIIT